MDKPNELIVTFDGSFDGLLTVVYNRFYENIKPDFIYSDNLVQQRLGAEIKNIQTDYKKSAIVYDAIIKKISGEAMHHAYQAYLRDDPEIFTMIYQYILFGFKVHSEVDKYLQRDFVLSVHDASKKVGREANFLREFIRFKETKDGVLYGEIGPDNNCLPIVAHHFTDRFLGLKWIICDKKRNIAAVFDGDSFVLTDMAGFKPENFTEKEEEYVALWKMFHKTIANESRVNLKLQTQVLPKKYRKYMTEFQKTSESP